ncbi:MAG: hypothetical protein V4584_17140 [Verrucomicrobiota bacterium]
MNPPGNRCCRHGRLTRAAGWGAPSILLVLIPKCPACFAAYVALVSGVGLSLPVASALRTGVIAVCGTALVFLAVRWLRMRFRI